MFLYTTTTAIYSNPKASPISSTSRKLSWGIAIGTASRLPSYKGCLEVCAWVLAQSDKPQRLFTRGPKHLCTWFPKVVAPKGPMRTACNAKVSAQAYMCCHGVRSMDNHFTEEKKAVSITDGFV